MLADTLSTVLNAFCGSLISKLGQKHVRLDTDCRSCRFFAAGFGLSGATGRLVAEYCSRGDLEDIKTVMDAGNGNGRMGKFS